MTAIDSLKLRALIEGLEQACPLPWRPQADSSIVEEEGGSDSGPRPLAGTTWIRKQGFLPSVDRSLEWTRIRYRPAPATARFSLWLISCCLLCIGGRPGLAPFGSSGSSKGH